MVVVSFLLWLVCYTYSQEFSCGTVHIYPAKGLSHLRAHNFVHRDIKPGNIMRCGTQDGRLEPHTLCVTFRATTLRTL